jgi:DNA-binding NtrC family response regulator
MQTDPTTVLVVDDEPFVREALARSLRRAGYTVVAAASAEEGLDLLRLHSFGCAISDWRMPGLGGRGFLEAAASEAPGLPVILMSGDHVIDELTGGYQHQQVLPKPWADSELRAVVARALRARASAA